MMCFYIDEYADVYGEEIRKARKEHKCGTCDRPIHKGERYLYSHGIFEGRAFGYKTCGVCELDRYRIHIHELGEGCPWYESWCPPDELLEYMEDTERERATRDEGQQYFDFHARRQAGYKQLRTLPV